MAYVEYSALREIHSKLSGFPVTTTPCHFSSVTSLLCCPRCDLCAYGQQHPPEGCAAARAPLNTSRRPIGGGGQRSKKAGDVEDGEEKWGGWEDSGEEGGCWVEEDARGTERLKSGGEGVVGRENVVVGGILERCQNKIEAGVLTS